MSSGYPGEPDQPRDEQDGGYGDEPTRPLGWQEPAGAGAWDPPTQEQPSYGQPSYDQPSYGQPSYGQPSYEQSYGQPAYGGQGSYPPPPGLYAGRTDHPNATTSLVLGICGLVFGLSCGLGFVLSPFAWVLGGRAVREIRASGGRYGGEGAAKAGQVTGIVGTVVLVLILLGIAALITIGVAGGFDSGGSTDYGNV